MEKENSTYTIRLPSDLKRDFEEACKIVDVKGAQIMRQAMRNFIKNYTEKTQTPEEPAKRNTQSDGLSEAQKAANAKREARAMKRIGNKNGN